jgi:hypothetical protein
MRADTKTVLLAAAGAVLLGAVPAAAQQTIQLRYRPEVGRTVRTVSWHEIAMTIGDLPVPGDADSDTLRLDVEMLQSVTERVREGLGGRYVVERWIDSTRSRMRAMSGSWRDVDLDSLGVGAAHLEINERFQVQEFGLTRGDTAGPVTEWLRNPAGTFELSFPEAAVAVGDSWSTELVMPLTTAGVELEEPGADVAKGAELVARVNVTLDSLVIRGVDTLAYLRARGSFLPLSVSQAAEVSEGSASIRGAFAGNLIWSTGWDAWVSGAARARFTVRVEVSGTEQVGGPGFEMRVLADARWQVRP